MKYNSFEKNRLFEKFKKLGWSDDPQSISIFNFLMLAKEEVKPNSILLDLGGGQCRYKFFFEHCHYLAVDQAQGDSQWDYSKLDFIGDVCHLNFIRNESIDNALNTTTLEHIKEPAEFFSEVQRILKGGGNLFLYVPFVYFEHQAPYDYYRYTSYALRYLCEKNGLKVISIKASNGPLYTGSRWAYITLQNIKSDKFYIKVMSKIIRGIFKFMIIPLFDYLERYSTNWDFPQCWLLVAKKEGPKNENTIIPSDKEEIVKSIIRCPECKASLKFSDDLCLCLKCRKQFLRKNGQINFLQH